MAHTYTCAKEDFLQEEQSELEQALIASTIAVEEREYPRRRSEELVVEINNYSERLSNLQKEYMRLSKKKKEAIKLKENMDKAYKRKVLRRKEMERERRRNLRKNSGLDPFPEPHIPDVENQLADVRYVNGVWHIFDVWLGEYIPEEEYDLGVQNSKDYMD